MSNERAYCTAKEFAEVVGLPEQSVRLQCRSGELPAIKVGKRWLVSMEHLSRMVEHETQQRTGGGCNGGAVDV